MTASDDAETLQLIDSARRGDDGALDELIKSHLPALRAFVRLRADRGLRDKEACSDLVQTACRQALVHLESYEWRGRGSFRNWLFSIATKKILNKHQFYGAERRSAAREADVSDAALRDIYGTVCTPARVAEAREEIARVEQLLDRLQDDQREVIVLSRIVGLSHGEIAEQMGRSEGAVRVLLSRALARLATWADRER